MLLKTKYKCSRNEIYLYLKSSENYNTYLFTHVKFSFECVSCMQISLQVYSLQHVLKNICHQHAHTSQNWQFSFIIWCSSLSVEHSVHSCISATGKTMYDAIMIITIKRKKHFHILLLTLIQMNTEAARHHIREFIQQRLYCRLN